MVTYAIRRLMLIPVTMVLLSLLFFFMLRTIPGDFVDVLFQEGGSGGYNNVQGEHHEGGQTTQEAYQEQMRDRFGLSDPAHVQYVRWVSHMLRGDFGDSYLAKKTALQVLKDRLPATIELGLLGLVGSILLGIPLGILSARYPESWIDNALRLFSIGGLSVPAFVTAAIIIVILSKEFQWIPPDYVPFTEDPWKNLQNMIFPAIVVSYTSAAPLMRLTRSQMLEVLSQDYIRTARAKGLPEQRIFYGHALRNAMLPIITVIGLSLDRLVAGSVIVEVVFGINGMGAALVRAAAERDFPVMQLFAMVLGLTVMTVNLLVDLMYGIIDPRIRLS
jgi:peptide/nickel transport system permease protein